MNHVSVGVYSNDEFKINVVAEDDLDNNIEYNKRFRFGRALFVDNKCIHAGYLSKTKVKEWESKINGMSIDSRVISQVYV